MALDYTQSADLMKDQVFIDRVKVSCLKFADYILNEPTNTPAHSTRVRWAQTTIQAPANASAVVTPPTVMDTAVQAEGNAISDTGLQTAVETTVNKLL
jgi:hypothetical protein